MRTGPWLQGRVRWGRTMWGGLLACTCRIGGQLGGGTAEARRLAIVGRAGRRAKVGGQAALDQGRRRRRGAPRHPSPLMHSCSARSYRSCYRFRRQPDYWESRKTWRTSSLARATFQRSTSGAGGSWFRRGDCSSSWTQRLARRGRAVPVHSERVLELLRLIVGPSSDDDRRRVVASTLDPAASSARRPFRVVPRRRALVRPSGSLLEVPAP